MFQRPDPQMFLNSRHQNRLWAILVLLPFVITIGSICRFSAYGFDFTDEGFYLNWVSNPFAYAASASQFGFFYHPFYLLCRGNILVLRLINIFLTIGPACLFSWLILEHLTPQVTLSRFTRVVAILSISATSMSVFDRWLVTPSYNSLTLQGLLFATSGLLLLRTTINRRRITGAVLLGVGGWMTFMGKPSSALGLAASSLAYLALARSLSVRDLVIAAGTALGMLVASALAIDNSLTAFVIRIQNGLEIARLTGGGHTIRNSLRVDDINISTETVINIAVASSLTILATAFLQVRSYWVRIGSLTFTAFASSFCILVMTNTTYQQARIDSSQGLILVSIPIAALTIAFHNFARSGFLNGQPSRGHFATIAFLTLNPMIYSFGTLNNYWTAGASAGIFWVAAGICALKVSPGTRIPTNYLLPFCTTMLTITGILIQSGMEHPYRQPAPIRKFTELAELGANKSSLYVPAEFASYIADAQKATKASGFVPGTSIIDLTGRSPGLLYALGATSVGQAWQIGGYPGSGERAIFALGLVSCDELAKSWILIEPNGPRQLPNDVLTGIGLEINLNYQFVTKWMTARGAGGYAESQAQHLLKPIATPELMSKSCRKKRTS